MTTAAAGVGPLLRHWRAERGVSQMALAHEAEVSTRHISFIETGRARPSREMVLVLASALDVPLRERNTLLASAGFSPAYRETELDAPEMAGVRETLQLILRQQEPNGAVVVDGRYDILMSNTAASRMTGLLARDPQATVTAGRPNLLRLLFHPLGVRDSVVNFDEVAHAILRRAFREAKLEHDTALLNLLDEVLGYPDVPADDRGWETRENIPIVIPIHFRNDVIDARIISTVTTLGTAQDITLRELRIETYYPADAESARAIRTLAAD